MVLGRRKQTTTTTATVDENVAAKIGYDIFLSVLAYAEDHGIKIRKVALKRPDVDDLSMGLLASTAVRMTTRYAPSDRPMTLFGVEVEVIEPRGDWICD